MNIKEIAILMVTDLIGELLNKSPLTNNHPEKNLVIMAEEIMDSRCDVIHTIQEIADGVFTSPRNLQKAFKKHRNYTPMQFLRERKLHKAHKLLSDKNLQSSVKNVALSVGIYDLNRFSKYYAELFDEYPSTTIKKSL